MTVMWSALNDDLLIALRMVAEEAGGDFQGLGSVTAELRVIDPDCPACVLLNPDDQRCKDRPEWRFRLYAEFLPIRCSRECADTPIRVAERQGHLVHKLR